jgi:hypothetical protein
MRNLLCLVEALYSSTILHTALLLIITIDFFTQYYICIEIYICYHKNIFYIQILTKDWYLIIACLTYITLVTKPVFIYI